MVSQFESGNNWSQHKKEHAKKKGGIIKWWLNDNESKNNGIVHEGHHHFYLEWGYINKINKKQENGIISTRKAQ